MAGFVSLFVALLTTGMPVFLVLGLCAAGSATPSAPRDDATHIRPEA